MSIHPNLVILAGGISSRMGSKIPKCMLRVGAKQRPFLDHLLDHVAVAGYREVVIVTPAADTTIRECYGEMNQPFPLLRISFVSQMIPKGAIKPLGSADALLQALISTPHWKGRSLTVCNSDNLYSTDALRELMNEQHENAMIDYDRAALNFSNERISAFAVIQKSNDGYVTDIIEKPSAAEIQATTDAGGRIGISMNIFRFSYDRILPYLHSIPVHPVRREKELSAAVRAMIAGNQRSLFAIRRSEHVPDLTFPGDVDTVTDLLKS